MSRIRQTRSDKIREMLDRPRTDPYVVLGVPRDAGDDEVKAAYRRLALEHHPDRSRGSAEAEERFKAVVEAYGVLSDDVKRAYFDKYGVDGGRRRKRSGRGSRSSPVVPREEEWGDKNGLVFDGYRDGVSYYHQAASRSRDTLPGVFRFPAKKAVG